MYTKGVLAELECLLTGKTNNEDFKTAGCNFWSQWAVKDTSPRDIQNDIHVGDLGPIYSEMWTNWPNGDGTTINQIQSIIDTLTENPDSRRQVVTAWNPSFLPDDRISPEDNVKNGKACLAYCHTLFQFYTDVLSVTERMEYASNTMGFNGDLVHQLIDVDVGIKEMDYINLPASERVLVDLDSDPEIIKAHSALDKLHIPRRSLSCKLYARSQDYMVGTPSNIAFYSVLTHLLQDQLNFAIGKYIHSTGDTHIYFNHVTQAEEQIKREPRPLPTLKWRRKPNGVFDFKASDVEFVDYNPHPPIRYPVAK